MREVQPTWKMAGEVIRVHVLAVVLMSSSLIVLGIASLSLILFLSGYTVTIDLLREIIIKYQRIFLWVFGVIHFGPVTLYGVIRSFQYKYKTFRVVIYAVDKPLKCAEMGDLST